MERLAKDSRQTINMIWLVVSLLFMIRLVNYLDRQTLSVLKTTLKAALDFSDSDYSLLLFAFMLPYILMYGASGWIIEALGTRRSMTLFAAVWSVGGLLSGFAQNFGQLAASRALLGAAEPGVFPLSQRVILNWVPERHRAFAFSVVSPSGSVGALLAPPVVAYLTIAASWRAAFIVPAVIGLILAALWWRIDRLPAERVDAATQSGVKLPVALLFKDRSFWGIVAARLVSDPVWFFYLFWIPGFMQDSLGLSLGQVGMVAGIPYLAALVACPVVGRITDLKTARGHNPARVQLWIFSLTAALMPLGALIAVTSNAVISIVIITLVTASAQLWFAGTSVMIAARLPARLNASAAGFVGATGATAGLIMSVIAGPVIETFGYAVVFTCLGLLHPASAVILWLTIGRRLPPDNRRVAGVAAA